MLVTLLSLLQRYTDNAMTKDFIGVHIVHQPTEHMLRSYMTLYSSIAKAGPIMSSDWFIIQ